MIFVISEDLSKIERVESKSFVTLDVWERKHIQEWIRSHPEILGEDLLIVGMEFDKFEGSKDRLDLLSVDREGNLAVVELKRDSFAGYADLQAIRYAAMVSTMTIEQLLIHYADYYKKTTGEYASKEELRARIHEFVELEDFEELSSRPRIILCSEDFSQEITTTVLWLRGFDLDISCVRLTPHRSEGKIILVPEKIIPLKESEQYLTGIQEKEEQRQESKRQVDPTRAKIREVLEGLIEKNSRLELDYSGKREVRFVVRDWDEPVLLQGTSEWGGSKRMLMLQFQNFPTNLKLTLHIGPGPQETRKKLFEMANAHPEVFGAAQQKLRDKWNQIFSRTLLEQEMYEDATESEREKEIHKQWIEFIEKDLPRIEDVLKKEQWIWQPSEAGETL